MRSQYMTDFTSPGAAGTTAVPILQPGEDGYDEARRVWNAMVDRRPAMIARCRETRDVVAAVELARREGLEIGVRCGGHSVVGHAVPEGGLMIDLTPMGEARVDPERRRARVQGGALLGALDVAAQAHGLATTAGNVSHTGVGGLTLGGGMGWLAREHGLTCDNLVSCELVTAAGEVVRASADENAELFWGLRGGGGNFGVVTEFGFRLHPVGPDVNFALLFWEIERGAEGLRACRDAIPDLPPDYGILIGGALSAPPEPFVPEEHHGRVGHAILVAGYGTAEEHARAIAPLREACPPLFELVTPVPYVALQQLLDDSAPWGVHCYDKALFLTDLTDDAITVMTERATGKQSPMTFMPVFALHGAVAAADRGATAYGGMRASHYVFDVSAVSFDPEVYAADRAWARSVWDAGLRGSSSGIPASTFPTRSAPTSAALV
jgi:hypothetical protein